MTSLVRVCADYGFGLRLQGDGLALVPPTRGEMPPDEIVAVLRENRAGLIGHLKAGGVTRCEACRATLYLDAATGPEIGAACGNDGRPDYDTTGIGEASQAVAIGVSPRCPFKRGMQS